MAWLSGLAGKAEEVLNSIDKSTAAVLKKEEGLDKRDLLESNLLEVRSLPPDSNLTVEEFLRNEESYLHPHDYVDKKQSMANKMAISAPTTPAHGERLMNMQSESLEWLNKEIIDPNNQNFDVSIPNQFDNFESKDDSFFISNRNHNGSDSLIVNLNGDSNEAKPSTSIKRESPRLSIREQKLQAEHLKQVESLNEKINALTTERSRFIREISDLTSTLEKTRLELNSVESELEQHRARAIKSLQERDKLISELRTNPGTETDDSSLLVELNQLKQEREMLREENLQVREKLRIARQESTEAELTAEKIRQKAMEASIEARELVAEEKKRRLEAEENAKLQNEEVRALREELSLRNNALTIKLQKQESEIARLRSKLSIAATPNSEVESRLSSLTRTLVLKQQEVEHLTTDRNALRLQLERLEHEYQSWRKTLPFNSMNDTDDAKALLPSFLMESPFDTGVTRRVKRAYSTLDAVSIRIGVFLRRYPIARIFVLVYLVLIQFWMVILFMFSKTPDAN